MWGVICKTQETGRTYKQRSIKIRQYILPALLIVGGDPFKSSP